MKISKVLRLRKTKFQFWHKNCLSSRLKLTCMFVSVFVYQSHFKCASHPCVSDLACVSYGCVCMCDGQLRVCCVSSNCTNVEKTGKPVLPQNIKLFSVPLIESLLSFYSVFFLL